MTDDELIKLADLIADRLIAHRNDKDVAWHDKSPVTIEDVLEDMPLSFKETPEEHMIGEIARLTTLLFMYQEQEEYRKMQIIQNKINRLQKKLDKL
jgi:hypothetical protein